MTISKMLQNKFYTISNIDKQADSLSAKFKINPDHNIFKGHFPSQPVVPGVCMVQIIRELLEEGVGEELLLKNAPQLKFLQLLVPEKDQEIVAEVKWQKDNTLYTCTAALKHKDQALFKMNAGFEKK